MSILNELAKGYQQLKDEEEKEAEKKAGKVNTEQEGQEEGEEESSLREQVELLSQAVLELHEKVNANQEKEDGEKEKGGAE
ncbi:hypothetical protein [Guptibacillus hwajinpoensis]|uniref:hypothetical protein n=1 Tax=Guptibacillus hwajinpoensis TaxID=208199 RepID=UPI0024B32B08|nr:hypothetical protein [Pseudalkalibacillus hwajinpoensis]